jgi:hypothetical protein
MAPALTRRRFAALAAAALAARPARPQSALTSVASMEHDHILAEARLPTKTTTPLEASASIANQTAAFVLTKDPTYATHAQTLLTTWLLKQPTPTTQPVVELTPYAEIAVALRFLGDALPADTLKDINAWFAALQTFLNTDRSAQIDRDRKDHRASAWLLLASAIARTQNNGDPLGSKAFEDCRARFRKPTLRNQILADGSFPQELATDNPYRNTLFNFDLLAGACQLLASPFDDLWHFELIDAVGMRAVAAYLVPRIQDPDIWGAIADAQHFRELPGRRPALLFAGRAYDRPEYVTLWQSLSATIPTDLADTFPIRQPILWTTRGPHGL